MRTKLENVTVMAVHDRGAICDIKLQGRNADKGATDDIDIKITEDVKQHPRLIETIILASMLNKELPSVTLDDDGSGNLVIKCVQSPFP
jgi:hypothetical protein